MAVIVSMANAGREVHPFFVPKASESPPHTGHSAERSSGGNVKHRKRQRTKSPSQECPIIEQSETITWVDQLNAAASGSLLGLNATLRSTNHQSESSNGRTAQARKRRGSNGPHISTRSGSRNGSSTGSPYPINTGISSSEETLQPAGANSHEDTAKTPPKKMLRVRSDGKLSSPKAKAPAQDVKPMRGRKSAKGGTVPKMLVANIRYGADPKFCTSIGRKIANILSGTARNSSPIKSKPSKPTDTLKPTHPFFLGVSKRDQCKRDVAQSKDDRGPETGDPPSTSKRGAVNPTKARVTSKPPAIPERSAGMFGLGGNSFSSDRARISRFSGSLEPLWPPEGMVHVRQETNSAETSPSTPHHVSKACRKFKEAEIRVPKEEQMITRYVDVVQAYRSDDESFRRVRSREWREFRRPLRRIVTGRELQQAVRQEVATKLPRPYADSTGRQDGDRVGIPQTAQSPPHPAVHHIYKGIATSLSAFDKFESETQDWVHKYAPACADHVLQAGREVLILRDWLKTLTINSVECRACDTSTTRDSSVSSRRAITKRKKRRAEELDGFVLSSDEEANEMCQLTDSADRPPTISMQKRSLIRPKDARDFNSGERVANAVVVSGPHGCGKTAAVYAVARELGFEVFEINAGSRRSGRDILDKVGDMTRNHLVKHARSDQSADANGEAEDMDLSSEKLKQDLDSGRQETMHSFFKSQVAPKKSPSKRKPKAQKPRPKKDPPRKVQSQKQSLILLEEVDVLFEEDKTFWATTLELLVQSKRPIIMTCTDEALLPLENMILHAILRFTHAPEQLATDYLLLVACNEGHILKRDAIINLYKSKGFDLRASMTELNFFCQMAIGDTKGGLEWMLINPPSTKSNEQDLELLRVVSEGTYLTGMCCLSAQHPTSSTAWSINQETEMSSEAWNGWGMDVGTCKAYVLPLTTEEKASRTLALHQLQVLEQIAETFSAIDTFPGRDPMVTDMTSLDTAQPELTEKARSNYIEGFSLLQADPVVDQTGVAEAIPFTLEACARRSIQISGNEFVDTAVSNEEIVSMITENMQARCSERPNVRFGYAAVFEPIARSTKPVLGIPKGPQISTFDGSLAVITEDLAPYVRSIVSYDLRLEEQRGLLSSSLSQPGQDSKRQRTTRASRAALEGGSKAYTRRERWFPNDTNFDLVLQSGGQGWQDIALKQAMAESPEGNGAGRGIDKGLRRNRNRE